MFLCATGNSDAVLCLVMVCIREWVGGLILISLPVRYQLLYSYIYVVPYTCSIDRLNHQNSKYNNETTNVMSCVPVCTRVRVCLWTWTVSVRCFPAPTTIQCDGKTRKKEIVWFELKSHRQTQNHINRVHGNMHCAQYGKRYSHIYRNNHLHNDRLWTYYELSVASQK